MKPSFADIRAITLAVVLSVIVVSPLAAESDEYCGGKYACASLPIVQITPFIVLNSDRGSRLGGAVAVRWKPRVSIEVDTDFGPGVLTSTAGLVLRAVSIGRFAVYLAAGGGVQRREFSSPLESEGGFSHSRHRLGTSVGVGTDVSVNSTWAVRADVRWFTDDWRLASGVTLGFGR